MHQEDLNWRTSSYTGSETCVEISDSDPPVVLVRDTKARELGSVTIRREAWVVFVRYAARH
ncbi:DUF397 domain-containing protein [Streptomyces griseorubiginosus]|uniref:DUF397 domain-containing protein n=1 Tax=Streptomyces griseorubiginosus TaxID=67304 RepID=UPI001AD71420|nr:DUF397 domain-containing protein [Streptomyces griseorubiginosus]MBO4259950.1 DUF397 domain-containing protein [Streptomyces griseorubiginosus]